MPVVLPNSLSTILKFLPHVIRPAVQVFVDIVAGNCVFLDINLELRNPILKGLLDLQIIAQRGIFARVSVIVLGQIFECGALSNVGAPFVPLLTANLLSLSAARSHPTS